MINELRHVFSEDELSTPRDKNGSQLGSSLGSTSSSPEKISQAPDATATHDSYVKEYKKMVTFLTQKNIIKTN